MREIEREIGGGEREKEREGGIEGGGEGGGGWVCVGGGRGEGGREGERSLASLTPRRQ